MPNSAGLILLAAGGSTRLGRPKQLLRFQGQSLLGRAASAALASCCRPIVVVLGAEADACRAEIADLPVSVTINSAWQRGMGSSLRAGLESLRATPSETAPFEPAAVVLMLVDQPGVDAELLDRLVAAWRETGRPIVASAYEQTLGVPALFSCERFEQLRTLPDDVGARGLIRDAPPSDVAVVEAPQGARDIDTPVDSALLE
ncbi:MAG: nucleotidyltransferase family protein [Phycisphaerae bacterium]